MPLPDLLQNFLRLPLIAAPMFLVSGPRLVVQCSKAGILGTFPALNQRTSEGYAMWLDEIAAELLGDIASGAPTYPFGVNLIVHKSNRRLDADLRITVDRKVPVVITSLGAVSELVDAVHSYGGLVFHDVINARHAHKAAEAGVDGIIAVCAGAGGHAGTLSPFALVPEIRRFFDKTIILSGAMSDGAQIAAARVLGADLAYMGTRFIATHESMASENYKAMVLQAQAADIRYTPAISGVSGNFLRSSIVAAGLDPEALPGTGKLEVGKQRAWKDVWSAGQGVGSVKDLPTVEELCARLETQYHEACALSLS